MNHLTANHFIQQLSRHAGENDIEKMKSFIKYSDPDTVCIGVHMRTVFETAKLYTELPLDEIEELLGSRYYEVRMGAVSIMDFQAKKKNISEEGRKALFELYLRRHDRINNWDFVDRAAPAVIGGFLLDKPKDILYELARSENMWERRTAIVSTHASIKKRDYDHTFRIAEMLIYDPEELIQKAVGGWIREAGKYDEQGLKRLLDQYAATMPRITLRYAVEKLDKEMKEHYMSQGK